MMRFRRAVQRYGDTPMPETPYARAGQMWDERIGSARVQSRNWRVMAFATTGLAMVLAGGLVVQSRENRVIPYLVAIDRMGTPNVLGPAPEMRDPNAAEIAWFLGRFIEDVRSVGLDPVVTRRNWLQAYDFVSPRGAAFLNGQAQLSDPFANQDQRTVSVELINVTAISSRSYQVRWSETNYAQGQRAGTSEWSAILTIRLQKPASAESLRRNPLGILIDGIDWSEELNSKNNQAGHEPDPSRDQSGQQIGEPI